MGPVMPTMQVAIVRARALAELIGDPKLIMLLDDLRQLSDDLGLEGRQGRISHSYDLLGLSFAYVWDDHSAHFREILVRILAIAEASKNDVILDACAKVEECFMRISHRVEYLEVFCRQKIEWS